MKNITAQDALGINHQFSIDGDAPSESEQVRIDSWLSERNKTLGVTPRDEDVGIFSETGRAVSRGFQLPQLAGGIAGGSPGMIAQQFRDIQESPPSKELQKQRKEIQEEGAEGLLPAIGAHLTRPRATAALIGESIGAMAPTFAAAGAGALAGGPPGALIGGAAAAGLSGPALEGASVFMELVAEKGLDPTKESDIVKALADEDLMDEVYKRGVVQRGIPIGALDAASFGVAGKALRVAKGPAMAERVSKVLKNTSTKWKARAATGTGLTAELGIQAGLGGTGERLAQLAAGEEYDPTAVAGEIVGELGPGAVETAIGFRARTEPERRAKSVEQELTDYRQKEQRLAERRAEAEADFEAKAGTAILPLSPPSAEAEAKTTQTSAGQVVDQPVDQTQALVQLKEAKPTEILSPEQTPGGVFIRGAETRQTFVGPFKSLEEANSVIQQYADQVDRKVAVTEDDIADAARAQELPSLFKDPVEEVAKKLKPKRLPKGTPVKVFKSWQQAPAGQALVSGYKRATKKEPAKIILENPETGQKQEFISDFLRVERLEAPEPSLLDSPLTEAQIEQLRNKKFDPDVNRWALRAGFERDAIERRIAEREEGDKTPPSEIHRQAREPDPQKSLLDNVRQMRRGSNYVTPTETFKAAAQPIQDALNARIKDMGLDSIVDVAVEPSLKSPEFDAAGVRGTTESNLANTKSIISVAVGSYEPNMSVASLTDKLTGVLRHEVIHAVRHAGVLAPTEWNALISHAKRAKFIDDRNKRYKFTFFEEAQNRYESIYTVDSLVNDPGHLAAIVARVDAPTDQSVQQEAERYRQELIEEEAVAEAFRAWGQQPRNVPSRQGGIFRRIVEFFKNIADVFRGRGLDDPNAIFEDIQEGRVDVSGSIEPQSQAAEAQTLEPEVQSRLVRKLMAAGMDEDVASARIDAVIAGRDYGRQTAFQKAMKGVVGALEGESISEALIRNYVNSLRPWYALEGEGRTPIADAAQSVAKALEMATAMSGRMEGMIQLGPLIRNADGTYSFSEDIDGIEAIHEEITPDTIEDYHRYAAARRESDRRDAGMVEGLDLKTEELQQLIDLAETHPEFKTTFDKYQAFNEKLVQFSVDTGLVAQDFADKLLSVSYLPFYRVMEADHAADPTDIVGPGMKKILDNPKAYHHKLKGGSKKPLGDFWETVTKNIYHIASASIRNDAMRQVGDLIRDDNDRDIGYELKSGQPKTNSTITYREEGREVRFHIDDPALYASIASMSPTQRTAWGTAMARVAGAFRMGITLFPGFMLRNLYRGKFSAWITTDADLDPTFTRTIKGMADAYRNGTATQAIKAMSGFGGYTYGMTDKDYSTTLMRNMRRRSQNFAQHPVRGTWDALGNMINQLEQVGEASEFAERVRLYEYMLDKGASEKEAAFQAMNLINFGRRGAGGSTLSKMVVELLPYVPFLNARIQGLYRIFEEQKGDPKVLGAIPRQVFKRGLLLAAATTGMWLLASSDDRWEDETIERKIGYDVFYIGDKTFYLPRAFEVGSMFGAFPVLMLDAITQQDGKDLSEGIAKIFLNTFAFNPIPQAAKPALEYVTNYDLFRFSPIENTTLKMLPPSQRYTQYTSATSKAIIDFVGDDIAEMFALSPLKLDHLSRGYLGSWGAFMLTINDAVFSWMGAVRGKPANAFTDPYSPHGLVIDALGGNTFMRDEGNRASKFVQEFYKLRREADSAWRGIQESVLQQDYDRADRIMEKKKAPLTLRKNLNRVGRKISEINRQLRAIAANPNMTPNQKHSQIKSLRQQKVKLAGRMYKIAKGFED